MRPEARPIEFNNSRARFYGKKKVIESSIYKIIFMFT